MYRASKQAGEDVATELQQKYGVKASAYQADVGDLSANEAVVTNIVKEFGRLDIIVINAGISDCFDALSCTPNKYREQMAVNLDGAFYSAQAAAKVFRSQGSGNIIFTTSMSAIIVNGPQYQSIVSIALVYTSVLIFYLDDLTAPCYFLRASEATKDCN